MLPALKQIEFGRLSIRVRHLMLQRVIGNMTEVWKRYWSTLQHVKKH